MRSIVEEALARSEEEGRLHTRVPEPNDINAELEEMLRDLRTVIKVVGCGGGGSNSAQRMANEGIKGAELVAINTDAQHLLRVNADKKILIGKRRQEVLAQVAFPKWARRLLWKAWMRFELLLKGVTWCSSPLALEGGLGPVLPR